MISYGARSLVRELYRFGYSTRQVSRITGWAKSYVAVLCQDILRKRIFRPPKIRLPKEESTHWRTNRAKARKIMAKHLGRKLETQEHVHHINHDFTDNRLENLMVLLASEHAKHHHPKNPIPRGQREHRKEYQKSYFLNAKSITEDCVICGGKFLKNKYSAIKTCSNSCGTTLSWRTRGSHKTSAMF